MTGVQTCALPILNSGASAITTQASKSFTTAIPPAIITSSGTSSSTSSGLSTSSTQTPYQVLPNQIDTTTQTFAPTSTVPASVTVGSPGAPANIFTVIAPTTVLTQNIINTTQNPTTVQATNVPSGGDLMSLNNITTFFKGYSGTLVPIQTDLVSSSVVQNPIITLNPNTPLISINNPPATVIPDQTPAVIADTTDVSTSVSTDNGWIDSWGSGGPG